MFVRDWCRFSVGFSPAGMMVGTATAKANIVLCDMSNITNPVNQYDMVGYLSSNIVPNPTNGTTNMAAYQSGGQTVMQWSRGVNNGDSLASQISLTGVSYVVWAYGTANAYSSSPLPAMQATAVDLSGVASVSPSPTVSPSYVAPSAQPSSVAYANSVVLTPGLTLWWNRVGSRFDFKAVLNSLAW